tara:strand:+ start:254 stop:667 length:414 start_codon:yes stop_codon:yes gene_type:complete
MQIKWNDQFLTGHEDIDSHHQELFFLTQAIDQALISHKRSDVEKIITYLEDYVVDHFKEEENIMLHYKFNGYEAHRHEHYLFREQMIVIRKQFEQNPSLTHSIFLIRQFIDAMMIHILKVDQKIATLVKTYHHEQSS